jgi:polysaccharide export outer membrane protein
MKLLSKLLVSFVLSWAAMLYAAETPTPAASRPASRADREDTTPNHHLRVGDVVDVQVFGEEELHVKSSIDSGGFISLNLIGKLKVEGLSVEEAGKKVREAYMVDYLVDPIVNLSVTDFAKFRFTILGQVKSPGVYTFTASEQLNILQAIAKAGGYTRIGSPSKIIVKRVVNGKESIIQVNAKAMAKEAGAQLFEVRPDDTISVEETVF